MRHIKLFENSKSLFEFTSAEDLKHVETLYNLESLFELDEEDIIIGYALGFIPKDQPSYIDVYDSSQTISDDDPNTSNGLSPYTHASQLPYFSKSLYESQSLIEYNCEYLLNQRTHLTQEPHSLKTDSIVDLITKCELFVMNENYLDHLIILFLLSTNIYSGKYSNGKKTNVLGGSNTVITKSIYKAFNRDDTLWDTTFWNNIKAYISPSIEHPTVDYFIEYNIMNKFMPFMKWMSETHNVNANIPHIIKHLDFTKWNELLKIHYDKKLLEDSNYKGIDIITKEVLAEILIDKRKLYSIYLPDSVTKIEPNSFSELNNLFRIYIPETVTTIGSYAFKNCKHLYHIRIPSNISNISPNTFEYCHALTTIDLTGTIKKIGEKAFYDCRNLTTIDLPESITDIGECAFSECINLTTINIPQSVKSISPGAFNNCKKLQKLLIPINTECKGNILMDMGMGKILPRCPHQNKRTYISRIWTIGSTTTTIVRVDKYQNKYNIECQCNRCVQNYLKKYVIVRGSSRKKRPTVKRGSSRKNHI